MRARSPFRSRRRSSGSSPAVHGRPRRGRMLMPGAGRRRGRRGRRGQRRRTAWRGLLRRPSGQRAERPGVPSPTRALRAFCARSARSRPRVQAERTARPTTAAAVAEPSRGDPKGAGGRSGEEREAQYEPGDGEQSTDVDQLTHGDRPPFTARAGRRDGTRRECNANANPSDPDASTKAGPRRIGRLGHARRTARWPPRPAHLPAAAPIVRSTKRTRSSTLARGSSTSA